VTIREALALTAAELKAANIDTFTLDASLLLAHLFNTNRTAIAAMGNDPLSEESFAALRALTKRRTNGECIAYITGKKEFRGLEFLVNFSVLVPRPDTETLVETAIAIINEQLTINNDGRVASNTIRVLDLCTGSGAVAISLKNELPALDVWATDISAEALETAKKNAQRLLPADSIHFLHADLYNALPSPHCSLFIDNCSFSPIPNSSFSLITCNPPYIPTDEMRSLPAEVQKEPRLALDGGDEGLAIIKRVIDGATEKLMRGGVLLLEADPRQMGKIAFLLERQGFCNVKLYKDLSRRERVIGGFFE